MCGAPGVSLEPKTSVQTRESLCRNASRPMNLPTSIREIAEVMFDLFSCDCLLHLYLYLHWPPS